MKHIDIIAFLASLVFCINSFGADRSNRPPRGDGRIAIFNYHENEFLELTFRDDTGYRPDAMKKIEWIFRSRDGEAHPINKELVDLIDHIQDRFGAEAVEIISCYRSQRYNKSLQTNGRGAASESLHTKGLACDIHLDEIDENDLFEYVKTLKAGGVGFYPRYAFVHLDVGPARTWRGKPPSDRILVGTENNPNIAWSAITDKNIYRRGDSINIVITNNGYEKMRLSTGSVWIEHFKKGKWSEHERIKTSGRGKRLKTGDKKEISRKVPKEQAFGKYRLVIFPAPDDTPMYSNEFYIKKSNSP